jgi:hypothetical protein
MSNIIIKLREWFKHIREWFKHKWHALWFVYFTLLVLLPLLCVLFCFYNAFLIQVGSLIFTGVAMLLVMLQNNEHISDTTKQQIEEMNKGTQEQIKSFQESTKELVQAFAKQCQEIVAQLKETTGILTKILEQNAKQSEEETRKRIAEEERVKLLEIEQDREIQREIDEEERIKPIIFVSGDTDSYFIFWTHYWLYFSNIGGDSNDMKFEAIFYSSSLGISTKRGKKFPIINRDQHQSFDCGNIKNFTAYNKIQVKISIRNVDEQKYCGEVTFDKNNGNRQRITLNKATG